MKRLFAVVTFAMIAFFASNNASAAIDKDEWKFEPTVGPAIDLHNWGGTQFDMNFKFGKGDMFNYLFGLDFA